MEVVDSRRVGRAGEQHRDGYLFVPDRAGVAGRGGGVREPGLARRSGRRAARCGSASRCVPSFKDAAAVLAGTRNTVAWPALGHAVAAYGIARAHCGQREQFGRLHVVPGGGHLFLLERPAETAAVVARFLTG